MTLLSIEFPLRKRNRVALDERKALNQFRLTSGEKRALARGVFVERVSRKKVLKKYGGKCGICGQRVNPRKFTLDHIIPLSKGGTHQFTNLQPAHKVCNKLKDNKMPGDVIVPFRKRAKRSKGYTNPPRYRRAAA